MSVSDEVSVLPKTAGPQVQDVEEKAATDKCLGWALQLEAAAEQFPLNEHQRHAPADCSRDPPADSMVP